MVPSNFAACADEPACVEAQPEIVPTSRVLESGFWPNGTAATLKRSPAVRAAPADAGGSHAWHDVAIVSPVMRRVFDRLAPLARADVSITLMGETGTGKDVLARIVHQSSSRAAKPFVVFDCGAVAQNLAESELLGHERGAFTGAWAAHAGAFERAHGGTLFLDEIGELPLELQTRLLRVLGNRAVRRVGGTAERPVDVRIVAATNRNLEREVAAGRFRQDLYFRLAAAVINVPALRDRREDLPWLTRSLLEDLGHANVAVTPAATRAIAARAWPGNVRELKNALACAVAFLEGPVLDAHHLPLPAPESEPSLHELQLGGIKLETLELVAIQQTLMQTHGNKARAAQLLGIAVSTLYEKLKKHPESFSADRRHVPATPAHPVE